MEKEPTPKGSGWRVLALKAGQKIEIENEGDLDEIVVEPWFHLERLNEKEWWMRIGDSRILARMRPDKSTEVEIERGYYGKVRGGSNTS